MFPHFVFAMKKKKHFVLESDEKKDTLFAKSIRIKCTVYTRV